MLESARRNVAVSRDMAGKTQEPHPELFIVSGKSVHVSEVTRELQRNLNGD
jgi:hypothetical protein